jgi:hypothetical protein
MEGNLILWVVILSFILRTVCSYVGKFIIVSVDNIGIVRTECSYGCKVIVEVGDNIGHCEKRNFIWREVYYFVW